MAAINRHDFEQEYFLLLHELQVTASSFASLDASLMQMRSLLDKISQTRFFLPPRERMAFCQKLQNIFENSRRSLTDFEELHREISVCLHSIREAYDLATEEISRLIASEKE